MDAQPLWFGPPDRRLFGWVHEPATGTARAAVVVCPSLGQEATFSHHALRDVSERLAARGFLVVRFDYHGTGDSMGRYEQPDRVRAWLRSIDEAVSLAQDLTSAPVVLLGLRLGALLAASATQSRSDVHGVVLWDSPRSGRSFVREQRTRHNVSVGGADSGRADFGALGLDATQETLDDLAWLNLRNLERIESEVALMINRPGLTSAPDLATRSGTPVTHLEAPDQDDFLLLETSPEATLAALTAWFEETYQETSPCSSPSPGDRTQQQLWLAGGRERVVHLGPHRLFGILNEPRELRSSTTVVFVPERHTPHIGSARQWTDAARAWSELGIRSLRFDLSGCGDSPPHPGVEGHQTFLVEHLDDVVEAVRGVTADPSDVVLVGLCSGAYLNLETALALAPRGIALINPVISFITPERSTDPRRQATQLTRPAVSRPLGRITGRLASRLATPELPPGLTLDPAFEWSRCLEAGYWRNFLHRRRPDLPGFVWTLLNRLLLTQQTEELLGRVTDRGTTVLLTAGDDDYEKFTLGSGRALRRLERRGRLQIARLPDLDHAMMRPVERERAHAVLTDFVSRLLLDAPSERTPRGPRPVALARR